MTAFALSVARELRSARLRLETVSIVDHAHLCAAMRALLHNALFYVVASERLGRAGAGALAAAGRLAETIRAVGVKPQGVSLDVDRARADALVALDDLVDVAATCEPTIVARCLGIARAGSGARSWRLRALHAEPSGSGPK